MSILVPAALFGLIPAVLMISAVLPPRRAVITAFICAWLFLPMAGYQLQGFPDYTKRTAIGLSVLLAMAVFHTHLLFALRPRWFDVPIVTYCLVCPVTSSLTNGDGLYDGLSGALSTSVTWGLPYLIGRVYFTSLENLRELALGILTGGLMYMPLCLWEMRMCPMLHYQVYGFGHIGWETVFGGYRPTVFMSCGLEVALWMTATATTGFWLWASGSLTNFKGYPMGWLVLGLSVTAVLCRVTGAVILLIIGLSFWFLLKWSGSRLPAVGLILLPILYIITRTMGVWSGEQAVTLIRTVVNEEKAHSLQFRIKNEDMMVQHALKQPWFGWGGYGRSLILNKSGRALAVIDGMWILALGLHGTVGLVAFESTLLLPMVLLIRRYPVRTWRTPTLAPTAVLVTLANLYSIDCLANAMANPIYFLVVGGVTGTLGATAKARMSHRAQPEGPDLSELLDHLHSSTNLAALPSSSAHLTAADRDPREAAAIHFGALGRSLMEHGMAREAEEAWSSAMQLWAELATDYPDDLEYRRCRLDGLNDAAWTLITCPGFDDRDIARAIQLAEQTVTSDPESATYWNTLGIAYFRARDWKAAIHALEQSTELDGGGTSFDSFVLAMAWWHQGDREQAHHWYLRGNAWMEEQNPDHEVLVRFREEATALLDSRPISV